ncbi:putative autotransporter adhesin-like protein [Mangrovibacterium marinum]|uniref:Putative autotransporter adhesin-like protein n=1 Tax=Mangrovibacterium marinum TaxID=1639118 RepID=A0A2T5C301_9BACT|nr:head GIN domain-containing protein [Mangrovibacterium marinum]PTN09120.1 putative autotransporter adhesin-like protein [Mangrovibacterium marinum]
MKKWSILSILVCLTFLFQSCWMLGPSVKGNGEVTEETRQLSDFSRLETSTGLEVLLLADSTEYVVIEADANLHQVIRTEIKEGTLKIFTESRIRSAKSKKVFVHYKQLESLQSSSGAVIRSGDPVVSRQLELRASSGSHQYLQINTKKLDSRCSSGAHIVIAGKCEDATLKASSGAHFKGHTFRTGKCVAETSSGAHIWIDVVDYLQADASSGGHLYYSGSPTQTELHSSSGGSISQKQ